jgi:hypothetical protein
LKLACTTNNHELHASRSQLTTVKLSQRAAVVHRSAATGKRRQHARVCVVDFERVRAYIHHHASRSSARTNTPGSPSLDKAPIGMCCGKCCSVLPRFNPPVLLYAITRPGVHNILLRTTKCGHRTALHATVERSAAHCATAKRAAGAHTTSHAISLTCNSRAGRVERVGRLHFWHILRRETISWHLLRHRILSRNHD